MKTREVVALGVLAVAALTVVWYLALAPSRGSSVEPGPSELALTATQNGGGSWVRYLVTVKNLGDVPYDGDVRLVNRVQGAASPGAGPAPVPYSNSVPPAAVTIGTATVPAVAPDSAYQAHVSVPSRTEVPVTFFAPPDYAEAEALDGSGERLAWTSVERSDAIPIALLSDSAAAGQQLADLTVTGWHLTVFEFRHGRGFPSDAALLAGYVAIVVDQFNSASLSRRQMDALRDFVGLGGNLVVAGGSSWRQTVLPLPADLTPVRPVATAVGSLAPVEDLAGLSLGLRAPIAKGSAEKGARTLLTTEGSALVAESAYGAGLVVQLAFDPTADPIAGSKVASSAWAEALGRGLVVQAGASPGTRIIPGPESLPLDLFPPNTDEHLPSPWLVGPLLLAYLLLVAPVNYLVLRQRLRRPALVWISTPLIALVFAGSFYSIGSRLQGTLRDDEIELLKVAPQGVSSFEYNQVLFPSRGNHELDFSAASLVAPLTLSTYQDLAGTCTRCLVQLAGVQVGEEHVVAGARPSVSERGVAYGSVRVVGSASVQPAKPGVVAHLTISGGQLKGTVANTGKARLRDLAVYSYNGTAYQRMLLPDLAPGVEVSVDAIPESVGATAIGPGIRTSEAARNDVIENAIAMAALSQDPQPVLVGFGELQPGRLLVDGANPPRVGLAAFEQPLSVEDADGMLADWSRVRLAATAGDSRSGFKDVYDIELPSGSGKGGLDLVYDGRQYGALQVYDWSAGAWRVPGAAPSSGRQTTLHIEPALLQDGILRVRVQESQISWGTGFVLPG